MSRELIYKNKSIGSQIAKPLGSNLKLIVKNCLNKVWDTTEANIFLTSTEWCCLLMQNILFKN